MIKQEQKLGGENGALIDNFIKNSKGVPSEIVVKLIRKVFLNKEMKGNYILKGFPRNQENLKVWINEMNHLVDLKIMLHLDLPGKDNQF